MAADRRLADATDGPYWNYRLDSGRAIRAWPGHGAEADAAYRRAIELAVESEDENADLAVLDEARAYAAQTKNVELARFTLETLTRVRPEKIEAWVDLARLESDAGGSAQAVFDRLLQQRKDDLDAHVAYAMARHQGHPTLPPHTWSAIVAISTRRIRSERWH